METEKETNSSDRYLLCNYFFSDKVIDRVKTDVKAFMTNREKNEKYFEFINWEKNENEIVVLTMYAYDDILLPKNYDTVFQIDKPDNFVHLDFTITQAVLGFMQVGQDIVTSANCKSQLQFGLDKQLSTLVLNFNFIISIRQRLWADGIQFPTCIKPCSLAANKRFAARLADGITISSCTTIS
jgi:AAA15 family ATPase/GTPase